MPRLNPTPTRLLRQWLDETPGHLWRIGQVVITPAASETGEAERFMFMHEADWNPTDSAAGSVAVHKTSLQKLAGMEDFRELLRWDTDGKFRPLRAAPNLRTGWILGPLDFADLVVALRFLYPGAVADWALHREGVLPVSSYEESAGRQTGRFSVVRKLGDERLAELLRDCCGAGCSRTPLWAGHSFPAPREGENGARIPLLCAEACNYFISKAREKILGRVD